MHMHMHVYIHIHTDTYICTCTCACTYSCVHIHLSGVCPSATSVAAAVAQARRLAAPPEIGDPERAQEATQEAGKACARVARAKR